MDSGHPFVTLREGHLAEALVAPHLGGWLLRYARQVPRRGLIDVLHFDQAVVDRYPQQMYAGNPLLFPLVSNNYADGKEHFYAWEGQIHPMPQHGFARRLPWKVLSQQATEVVMELTDTEVTRGNYPFQFSHQVTYSLEQGRLLFAQRIQNRSEVAMPFGTGIHPYFHLPLTDASEREACYVRLPAAQRARPRPQAVGFELSEFGPQELSVAEDVSGTLFLTNLAEPEVALVDPHSELQIVLNWADAPRHRHLAIWSKSTQDPFYCLEPWTSLSNAFGRPQDRDWVLLAPGETFQASMWIDLEGASGRIDC